MKYIIIALLLVIIGLITYIIKMKNEIKNISKQIGNSKGEYINIHTKAMDSAIEELVVNVNYIYDESQKVKAKNRKIEEEIRRSIANMVHDLRTPLTSIIGYIQLVKSEGTNEEEKKSYMDIVEKRTVRLGNLISSFYDLSRLHSSEYNFNLKKMNLNTILCDNIALYYNDFIQKNIEPIVEIDEKNLYIISDEDAVNRVFSNLIGNMLNHGSGNIKISLREKDGYVLSEFSNAAPDLDSNEVQKLFDRFYTADKSRNDENTGLGLSITKTFVEELGNEIKSEIVNGILKIIIKWKK